MIATWQFYENARPNQVAPTSPWGQRRTRVRARRPIEPGRIQVVDSAASAPYQLTERSWFVMLAAVCLWYCDGLEPAIFVTRSSSLLLLVAPRERPPGHLHRRLWACRARSYSPIVIYIVQNLLA